ncbi:50S ribosomal protein L11 [symbiont of Argiope bruennichi]|uniref:50S ribosomal protein L11 n=1 Tax=symbiont of Argiope bruennichi TaxID=2810479 RepID=UPI003DA3BCD4
MKTIKRIAKIRFNGGSAKPCAALAGLSINMPQFCNAFNEKTKNNPNDLFPVSITVYSDKSFDFEIKTPPTSVLIKKMINLEKGSSDVKKNKVGKIKLSQIKEIAKIKIPDMNTVDLDVACKSIIGSAKSMGLEIIESE